MEYWSAGVLEKNPILQQIEVVRTLKAAYTNVYPTTHPPNRSHSI
jgi:hypothetical protein